MRKVRLEVAEQEAVERASRNARGLARFRWRKEAGVDMGGVSPPEVVERKGRQRGKPKPAKIEPPPPARPARKSKSEPPRVKERPVRASGDGKPPRPQSVRVEAFAPLRGAKRQKKEWSIPSPKPKRKNRK